MKLYVYVFEGVRVSDLRDLQSSQNHGQMSKSNSISSQLKTLDNYFAKPSQSKDKNPMEQEEKEEEEKETDKSADFHKFSFFFCPHCEVDFYSNDDFFFQHIDSCFLCH